MVITLHPISILSLFPPFVNPVPVYFAVPKQEHQFLQCPSFEALRQQPQLIAILSRALQKVSTTTASIKPPARQVRQLTAPVDLLDQTAPASFDDIIASAILEAGEGVPSASSLPTFEPGEGSPDVSPTANSASPDFP
jgi:hypothetical protein